MKRLIAFAVLLTACAGGVAERPEIADAEVALFTPGIVFELDDSARLETPAADALARLNAAMCLGLRTGPGGQHRISLVHKAEIPGGKAGHTGGSWDAARIHISKSLRGPRIEELVVHEVWHVLARTNTHAGAGIAAADAKGPLDAEALTEICAVQDCRCFTPEPPAQD